MRIRAIVVCAAVLALGAGTAALPPVRGFGSTATPLALAGFGDGRWELQVDRAWDGASGHPRFPSDQLDESDYQPIEAGPTYKVTVTGAAATVAVGSPPVSGTRAFVSDEHVRFDLTEGTFAGGRFVVWSADGKLQAELTIYGSGRPIISSERGELLPHPTAAGEPLTEVFVPVVGRHWSAGAEAPETQIELEAQFGGASWAIAVDGETAYLGLGATVAVVDVSDLDAPEIVGRSDVLPGVVRGVAVDGGHVYATVDDRHQATGLGGLYVIDVADPARPRIASSLLIELGGEGVTVEDGFAYVVSGPMADIGTAELLIVDVSRPRQLVLLGRLLLDGPYSPPVLAGDRLYVGWSIVDVSDHGQPRLMGTLGPPHIGLIVGVEAAGPHAYVLGFVGGQSLMVLDVTDPDNVVLVGQAALDERTDELRASVGDGLAVVTGDRWPEFEDPGGGRLQVVDISEPSAPHVSATLDTPGISFGVAVEGGVALATHNFGEWESVSENQFALAGGMLVVDASDRAAPSVRGGIRGPGGFISAVDVSGGHAWFAEGHTNWYEPGNVYGRLWSVGEGGGDHSPPKIMSSVELGTKPIDLAVDGGIALTAHVRDAVQAIDVTYPTDPALVGPVAVAARTLAVQDHVMVATEPERDAVVTVDVSDPSAPRALGRMSYDSGHERVPITLEPGQAWMPRVYIDVLDVSDPSSPKISAVLPIEDRYVVAVDVVEELAYAATADLVDVGGHQRLLVLDAQSLAWPRVLGEVILPTDGGHYGWVQDIAVAGEWAWVAMSSGAVFLVDIADAAAPRFVDRIDKPAYILSTVPDTVWQYGAIGLSASGDRAYVAYDPGGFVVLRAVRR